MTLPPANDKNETHLELDKSKTSNSYLGDIDGKIVFALIIFVLSLSTV